MGLPKVNTCCCGCSLRFGAAVIGILYGIATLSSTISLSIYARDLNSWNYYDHDSYVRDYTVAIIQAIISAFMLLTCVYLVLGAMQNKASYVRPWIAINSVILIIEAIAYGIIFIIALVNGVDAGLAVGYLAGYVIGLCIAYYFLVVVNSYHNSLLNQDVVFHTPPLPPGTVRGEAYPPPYSFPQTVHVVSVPAQAGQPPNYGATSPVTVGFAVPQDPPYVATK